MLKRYRWVLVAIGVVVIAGAFLAFRPDKLFVDDAVDESLADAFTTTTATTPTTTTGPDASSPSTTLLPESTTTTTEAPPSGPVALASGAFFGIDHTAAGTATVYEQGGAFVLRFEDDTDIQNGPDLFVWLLADEDYEGGDPGEYIDLGKIKGNVGGQNYELPDDYDPAVHQFVLVWCKRFAVPFAAAPLQ
jgi:hypothetical protein